MNVRLWIWCMLCHDIFCKVEFNQPSCWLYSMPNLLVIQHLETLYLGANHVRVVCERVWRKAQDCALSKGLAIGSRGLEVAKGCTRVKHAEELNSHASWSTIRQKVQSGHSVSLWLGLATQSSREAESPVHSIWEKLTLCIPYTHQYKYLLYPRNVESF